MSVTHEIILVDALYINSSGGLHLLEYLVYELQSRNVLFHLLADSRCVGIFDNLNSVEYMDASLSKRKRWYKKHVLDFKKVLCFGNIPAPIKLNVPVYTYFHNINLLTLSQANNLKSKAIAWLKREIFRYYKEHTNFWLVQTSNTANELIFHLKERPERVKVMPFYELLDALCILKYGNHGEDYVFVSDYTGAKGHEELLKAWEKLHQMGVDRTLHLTAHERNVTFIEKVKKVNQRGVKVINHGFIPFNQVLGLYKNSKAIIYPSHNESLGLGLVEAIEAGCDVIASDLPFTHSICKPSVVFNPYYVDSIVDAVLKYESGLCRKSELLIHNHIDEMVNLLS